MVKIAFVLSAIDPLNGAGFTLDLGVLQGFGVKAVGIPTGILPQDPSGVKKAIFFPGRWISEGFEPLREMKFSGLKVSIVGNSWRILEEIMERVEGPRVLDPIIRAGGLKVSPVSRLRGLISRFDLVTPNIPEAAELLGKEGSPQELCTGLHRKFGISVFLKGGHSRDKVDYLCHRGEVVKFPPEVVFPYEVHGTGCLLSSAILALMVRGREVRWAVEEARKFLLEKYRSALSLGKGKRIFR